MDTEAEEEEDDFVEAEADFEEENGEDADLEPEDATATEAARLLTFKSVADFAAKKISVDAFVFAFIEEYTVTRTQTGLDLTKFLAYDHVGDIMAITLWHNDGIKVRIPK